MKSVIESFVEVSNIKKSESIAGKTITKDKLQQNNFCMTMTLTKTKRESPDRTLFSARSI